MIYTVNGERVSVAYDVHGQVINSAYDKDGEERFPDDSLRIMTYNVGGWYDGSGSNVPSTKRDAYYALQTGMIRGNDPDILIVQEYMQDFSSDGTSALTMLQGIFPYVYAVSDGTYMGRAFCSRYPITDYEHNSFTAESNRYFDAVTVTINNTPIKVVDTHLGLTLANRKLEIAQLIGYLETLGTFICGGDFNLIDCKTTDGEDYKEIMTQILAAGFNVANCYGDHFLTTYEDNGWVGCLDNIVTSSNIEIVSATVDTTKLTDGITDKVDHMPLIATIEL